MTDILKRMAIIAAGTCSCGIKAPGTHFHAEDCTFRIMSDAMAEITTLRAVQKMRLSVKPATSGTTIDTLVDRFLAWPLPQSVCSDLCVTQTDGAFAHLRTGTNLLSAAEARAMIQYLLHIGPSHYVCPVEIQKLFELEQTKPQGRTLAVEWLRTLSLNYGDQIWLPELGWLTKSHPQDGEEVVPHSTLAG